MTVVKVRALNGAIRNMSKDNQQLLEKAIFDCQDTLLFASPTDRLITLGKDKINYLIKPDASLRSYTLKVLPYFIGTRPGRLLTPLDFQVYFKEIRPLALGKELKIPFDPTRFPVTSDSYFIAYYKDLNTSKLVEVKIPVINGKLIFHQDSVATAGQTSQNEVAKLLLYYRTVKDEGEIHREPLGSPVITYAETSILKQEIGMLLASEPDNGISRIKQLEQYLFMMYEGARPSRSDLRQWIKHHFGLEI
ncbi:MAG: hypothetical protein HRU41_35950 [Saprospiraceae bacterium]|nr:hypothetical protein [Saprospiraceae bacterium]